jgi:hypothetical protein
MMIGNLSSSKYWATISEPHDQSWQYFGPRFKRGWQKKEWMLKGSRSEAGYRRGFEDSDLFYVVTFVLFSQAEQAQDRQLKSAQSAHET